ncbi:hypothetical protein GXW78_05860 [Roseomonas terrae]|uniref:Uncharacterized protein n=1 Tax=Neoroseomonas terrae TaxID=424799 RepID=A0ABS5EDU0_9PROT|nr:hypothetical protein [Neoroseomonas terrae]MBR0649179.1 hypothetical protein [Neoroseomonas terrae]
MRRKLLVLTLLASLPIEAQADRAFCQGLQGLVAAAQSRFDWLPTTGRNIPGSIEERRGVVQNHVGGEPHGVYYAVMYRHDGNTGAHERFAALQHEIGACLSGASFLGVTQGQGNAQANWQTQYARVGLRRADGDGELPQSLVELSVASRW